MNYYNDNDKFIVLALKELIDAKIIPQGKVDDRSITEIKPNDLKGFRQCHFFSGGGGWSIALRLSGWPDNRHVWTGSCPCQPFSVAGVGKAFDDERHLWPAFRWLIAQRQPSIVFGEQVASANGRTWLDNVRIDLEVMGYEVGAADLCAASVGAPHIRQRLWFIANANRTRCVRTGPPQPEKWQRNSIAFGKGSEISNSNEKRWQNAKGRTGSPQGWRGEFGTDNVERRTRQWPLEPEMVRVVHGIHTSSRSVAAYGNAIVPQVAAKFIKATMDILAT